MKEHCTILFLCTGNAARSVMAEALANGLSHGRIRAYSAGSHPTGQVQPLALDALQQAGIATDGLRSKSWDAFAAADAPAIDIVITVCGNAAGETCPVWPGRPITAHWGVDDPVAASGDDTMKRKAFRDAMHLLRHRITLLLDLLPQALDRATLQQRIREIGLQSPSDPA